MGDVESSPQQKLAEQFYEWELRGRGWQVWDAPVSLEPPFRPFFGHWLSNQPPVDDGHRPTLLSGLFAWLHQRFGGVKSDEPVGQATEDDPIPAEASEPGVWTELRIAIPADLVVSKVASEQLLLSLSSCRGTIAFEIIGLPDEVRVQIACASDDAEFIERQLLAHFPEVVISRGVDLLDESWNDARDVDTAVVEFGLNNEFMLPLVTPRDFSDDALAGVVAALSDVAADEVALLQILFQPVTHPWAQSMLRAVVWCDGTPFFCGARDFVGPVKTKISRPLYGTVVRITCRSNERAWELAARLGGTFASWADPNGNQLIPLENDGYDDEEHAADVPLRRSRRGGMILNSDELVSFVHLPSASVRTQKLRQSLRRSCSPPVQVLNHKLVLGLNEHGSVSKQVTLNSEQRARHLHVLGASGTGKSTFLLNLITQDIQNGDGVAVFDPHGDLIDAVLDRIPPSRAKDVVLIDPADEAFPVGFKILTAHSELEKNLLASDLVAVFRRLSTSWGDQMTSVLGNAILAFVESSRGGTLSDLRRFLVEPAYRKEFSPP